MSNERWTRIKPGDPDIMGVLAKRYKAVEGQRVESIRWCETHRCDAVASGVKCIRAISQDMLLNCRIVDATLILPAKAPERNPTASPSVAEA